MNIIDCARKNLKQRKNFIPLDIISDQCNVLITPYRLKMNSDDKGFIYEMYVIYNNWYNGEEHETFFKTHNEEKFIKLARSQLCTAKQI